MKPSNSYKSSGREEVNEIIESNILSLFHINPSKKTISQIQKDMKDYRNADYTLFEIISTLYNSEFFAKEGEGKPKEGDLYYLVN